MEKLITADIISEAPGSAGFSLGFQSMGSTGGEPAGGRKGGARIFLPLRSQQWLHFFQGLPTRRVQSPQRNPGS